MRIKVFTLFPEMLRPMLEASILGRAIAAGLLEVQLIDIREYTLDKHRRTDDYPFGGGAGMVMSAQPILDAFAANLAHPSPVRRIYLSPRGRTLNQRIVEELAREQELVLLCGHYEGVDQRVLDAVIDEELSIGDYVLTGGELGALVLIDAVARLIPGVLGSEESGEDESFTTGLLEYPQYTRPADFRGMKVPQVLLEGNHAHITAWRREQSLELTLRRRPELLDSAPLSEEDQNMLARLRQAVKADAFLKDLGVGFTRLSLREADAFPRAWLEAFVPGDRLKLAKKQCLAGRRRRGDLAAAFRTEFIPQWLEGDAALMAWEREPAQGCLLFLQEAGLLYRLEEGISPKASEALGPAILSDAAMTRTLYLKSGFRYARR